MNIYLFKYFYYQYIYIVLEIIINIYLLRYYYDFYLYSKKKIQGIENNVTKKKKIYTKNPYCRKVNKFFKYFFLILAFPYKQ